METRMNHSSPDDHHAAGRQSAINARREFLKAAAATSAAAMMASPARPAPAAITSKLCFFSKPLPQMNWQRLAESVGRVGYGGIDLTVRPGGHVLPERVTEDLPRAVAAIRAAGLDVPMITTGLTSANDPAAQPTLAAAAKLGIPFYKPGYYKYAFKDARAEVEQMARDFRPLAELGRQHKMQVGFHNHAGYIGAAIWDIAPMIESMDRQWVGYYFDPRHATVEGGDAGWRLALELVTPRLKMVAVKDFFWEKTAKGWRQHNCPLGEGMVNWNYFFKALAAANFSGPISVHLEYEIPGKTTAEKEDNTLVAAERDLKFVKARIQEAVAQR
jgi:L-ribulose-5-phosphate 3-epimerase